MQVVLSYGMLLDIIDDRSRMFTGNRLPGAISIIHNLRKQKRIKYFLLNGYNVVFSDDFQILPILKLKQTHSLYNVPSGIQDESIWSFNKTGRMVCFNECDYEFNSLKNKVSKRIYCNPYDDNQVNGFLASLNDEEPCDKKFDLFISELKDVPRSDILVYADQYIFNEAHKFELPFHMDYASETLAQYLFDKLELIISKLIDFHKYRNQSIFICLKKNSFDVVKLFFQRQYIHEFIIMLNLKFKNKLNLIGNINSFIIINDIHDRIIISDYFMLRSTSSFSTEWSNVNYQGVSQNLVEYFKSANHAIMGKWNNNQDYLSIPELRRLKEESMIVVSFRENSIK